MTDQTTAEDDFERQCDEAGRKIIKILLSYPRPVAVWVLPVVLVSVMEALGVPREVVIRAIDGTFGAQG